MKETHPTPQHLFLRGAYPCPSAIQQTQRNKEVYSQNRRRQGRLGSGENFLALICVCLSGPMPAGINGQDPPVLKNPYREPALSPNLFIGFLALAEGQGLAGKGGKYGLR